MKNLVFILLSWTSIGWAQPAINEWYPLNNPQTEFNGIVSNDSCYYVSSSVIHSQSPYTWDLLFSRIDLQGNVLSTKSFHTDSSNTSCSGSNLLDSFDGELITICSHKRSYLFCRYSPVQDTIFVEVLDTMYYHHGFDIGEPGKVIQISADSTFYFSAQLQDTLTQEIFLGVFHCNKLGELIEFNSFPVDNGYFTWIAGDVLDVGDGLTFYNCILYLGLNDTSSRQYLREIKTDYSLNLISSQTDWNRKHEVFPSSAHINGNNEIIISSASGEYDLDHDGILFYPTVTKLNSDLSVNWTFKVYWGGIDYFSRCTEIIDIGNEEYIGVGHRSTDSVRQGWMVKFNETGDILWDSYFSYIQGPYQSFTNKPTNEIYGIDKTLDGGYVMCGTAHNVDLSQQGTNARFGWVLKTDSEGCLVPGCQTPGSIDEVLKLKLQLYPNPSSNNLFIYLPAFNSSKNEVFKVHNLNGQLVSQWIAAFDDNTYILDVTDYKSGTYILTLEDENGVLSTEKFIKE